MEVMCIKVQTLKARYSLQLNFRNVFILRYPEKQNRFNGRQAVMFVHARITIFTNYITR